MTRDLRLDARFLAEGDRFDWDGTAHLVDDDPVVDGGTVIVPTRAGPDATWVELPAGTRVPLHGMDPVRFGVALSQLPADHPLIAAAGLAVETVHTRHQQQRDHLDLRHDISGALDWSRFAATHLTHADLQARRAAPAPPPGRPAPTRAATSHDSQEHAMTDPSPTEHTPAGPAADIEHLVRARAAYPGYMLIGPFARTWLRDPVTGRPDVEVSEEEHRTVRRLLERETLHAHTQKWETGPDGRDELHTVVGENDEWTDEPGADDPFADDDAPADRPDTPTLAGLLETWQTWSQSNLFARLETEARAAGDTARADRLHDLVDDNAVGAVEALTAQHEVASLLAGWEWHTVRAARDQGASWSQIAEATRTDPEQARTAYLAKVDQHERVMAGIEGMSFDDAEDWRAAAGDWLAELHPDTPADIVEQITTAAAAGDTDGLDRLRAVWWNPDHRPAAEGVSYRTQPRHQHRAVDTAEAWAEPPPSTRGAPGRPDLDDGDAGHESAGFVPRIGADLDGRYETVSCVEAVERVTAAGFDHADAERMVAEYVEDTAARYGVPTAGWGFDRYDLAEITRADEPTADARSHAIELPVAVDRPEPIPEVVTRGGPSDGWPDGPYPELAARVAAVHEQATDQAADAVVTHHDDVTDGADDEQGQHR